MHIIICYYFTFGINKCVMNLSHHGLLDFFRQIYSSFVVSIICETLSTFKLIQFCIIFYYVFSKKSGVILELHQTLAFMVSKCSYRCNQSIKKWKFSSSHSYCYCCTEADSWMFKVFCCLLVSNLSTIIQLIFLFEFTNEITKKVWSLLNTESE